MPDPRPLSLLYISMLADPAVHDLSVYLDRARDGDDRDWLGRRLDELGLRDRVALTTCSVFEGELPAAGRFDAVIVGGSLHSVGERTPWQRRLAGWLDGCRATTRPLLGICGGHQLVCQMRGQPVELLPGGAWTGTRAVRLSPAGLKHPLFRGLGDDVAFHFGNQEHVTSAPDGATVLADADGSPCLALDHGGGWLSLQFHPEATAAVMARAARGADPDRPADYREVASGPALLRNFLAIASLDRPVAAD